MIDHVTQNLENFTYSVSHGLRAPLRHIDGFLEPLEKKTQDALDEHARRYLKKLLYSITANTRRFRWKS